ncbi:MAG TPA: radical SAM protein [bacterium]|nr:radical SAM protein [bacterium]
MRFAPLYISNLCKNCCLYCAFRADNKKAKRRSLTREEIANEVRLLESMGHKRILMLAGEAYPEEGVKYIYKSIATIYSVREGKGEIRRVNVNTAPWTRSSPTWCGRATSRRSASDATGRAAPARTSWTWPSPG